MLCCKTSALVMLVMTSSLHLSASEMNQNASIEERITQLLSPLEHAFANRSGSQTSASSRVHVSGSSVSNEGIVIAVGFLNPGASSVQSVMQWKPEVPVLSDITIQFWFRLQHTSADVNVIMNYFKENDDICLYHDRENKEVILDAQAYKISAKVDVPPYTWTHFLVTLGLVSAEYYVQMNGRKLASRLEVNNKTKERKPAGGGGVLLLGRKQGSQDDQSSSLEIAEFCIFPTLLSESGDILDCGVNGGGRASAIVTTNRIIDWFIQGDIRIFSVSRRQLLRNLEGPESSFLENSLSEENLCLIFGLSMTDKSGVEKNIMNKKASPNLKCLPSHNALQIYGLCKVSHLDRELYIQGMFNQKPEFHGAYTKLWWDNATWTLTSRLVPQLEAKMVQNNPDNLPMGLRQWRISGDGCPAGEVDLLLTMCAEESFTCNDGTCVDMSQRCDLRAHCDDGSDEMECDKVFVGSDYEKTLPPPPPETEDVLNVTLSLVTHAVHDLDLLAQTVRLDVLLISQWEDARLQYADLHSEQFRNEIQDPDRLWQPRFTVTDDTGSRVRIEERGSSLRVLRGSSPLPRENIRALKATVYPGKGNVLFLRQELSIAFQCQFDLRWFPFDVQRCSINLRFAAMESKLLRMLGTKAKYLGQTKLHEYKVEFIDMTEEKQENGQRVTLCLTNLFVYYLVNSYLPSFLLVIISYSTFYFPLEGFNERIMANITAMLVLVALFQQPCSTILKTTYLKLIDVWYMICIVVDFIMVILLVIIDYIRNTGDGVTKIFPASAGVKPLFAVENWPNARKFNTIAKVMLPLLFLLLFGVYGFFSTIQYATG
ncbi:uncharacterized protein LOC134762215 [Penaeus indicus]|uniref:uncharacterized protein LOC134762215 n=1 Tax=Penaeus indicus TaxID=29960 RepID=UPI00300CF1B1